MTFLFSNLNTLYNPSKQSIYVTNWAYFSENVQQEMLSYLHVSPGSLNSINTKNQGPAKGTMT